MTALPAARPECKLQGMTAVPVPTLRDAHEERLRLARRALRITLAGFALVACTWAGLQVVGNARMLLAVGIGQAHAEAPVCSHWDYGWSSRYVKCGSPLIPEEEPTSPRLMSPGVGLAAGIRRIRVAQYSWLAADSLTWTDARDSLRKAIAARGGHYVPCGNPIAWAPPGYPDTGIFRWQGVWRFPGYYLEASAYRLVQFARSPAGGIVSAGERPTLWLLSVTGTVDAPLECD